MRIRTLVLNATLLALPASTFAEVDCTRIMEELKAGRTPQGVMEGHRINENDIKSCRAEADRDAWQAGMRGNGSVPDANAPLPALPENVEDRGR
jgi:hypothetical protein